MLRRWLGIATACSVLALGLAAPAQAVQVEESISAVGSAPWTARNPALAKKDALRAALVAVLEKVAQRWIPVEIFAANVDILSWRLEKSATRLIRDYRLIREGRKEGAFEVEVSAMPRYDLLQSHLLDWGIMYDRPQRPVFGLMALKTAQGRGAAQKIDVKLWTRQLSKRLSQIGYEVVEVGKKQAASFDIGIVGEISSFGSNSVAATLRTYVQKNRGALGRLRKTVSLEKGTNKAAGILALSLLEKTLPAWFREIGEARVYTLTVTGISSYRSYQAFRKILNSGRWGFASGWDKVYSPGEVTFQVVFNGSMARLVRTLRELKVAGETFRVAEAKGKAVRLEVKKKK